MRGRRTVRTRPTCPSGASALEIANPWAGLFGEDSEDGVLGQGQLPAFPEAGIVWPGG